MPKEGEVPASGLPPNATVSSITVNGEVYNVLSIASSGGETPTHLPEEIKGAIEAATARYIDKAKETARSFLDRKEILLRPPTEFHCQECQARHLMIFLFSKRIIEKAEEFTSNQTLELALDLLMTADTSNRAMASVDRAL